MSGQFCNLYTIEHTLWSTLWKRVLAIRKHISLPLTRRAESCMKENLTFSGFAHFKLWEQRTDSGDAGEQRYCLFSSRVPVGSVCLYSSPEQLQQCMNQLEHGKLWRNASIMKKDNPVYAGVQHRQISSHHYKTDSCWCHALNLVESC